MAVSFCHRQAFHFSINPNLLVAISSIVRSPRSLQWLGFQSTAVLCLRPTSDKLETHCIQANIEQSSKSMLSTRTLPNIVVHIDRAGCAPKDGTAPAAGGRIPTERAARAPAAAEETALVAQKAGVTELCSGRKKTVVTEKLAWKSLAHCVKPETGV